ncbi:hypothetical protein ANO11243_094340 [Dothideomycetidae sp. 11243]|nr:hypothetical protein ANO11243_094340 [fungal sp. No.11243]
MPALSLAARKGRSGRGALAPGRNFLGPAQHEDWGQSSRDRSTTIRSQKPESPRRSSNKTSATLVHVWAYQGQTIFVVKNYHDRSQPQRLPTAAYSIGCSSGSVCIGRCALSPSTAATHGLDHRDGREQNLVAGLAPKPDLDAGARPAVTAQVDHGASLRIDARQLCQINALPRDLVAACRHHVELGAEEALLAQLVIAAIQAQINSAEIAQPSGGDYRGVVRGRELNVVVERVGDTRKDRLRCPIVGDDEVGLAQVVSLEGKDPGGCHGLRRDGAMVCDAGIENLGLREIL